MPLCASIERRVVSSQAHMRSESSSDTHLCECAFSQLEAERWGQSTCIPASRAAQVVGLRTLRFAGAWLAGAVLATRATDGSVQAASAPLTLGAHGRGSRCAWRGGGWQGGGLWPRKSVEPHGPHLVDISDTCRWSSRSTNRRGVCVCVCVRRCGVRVATTPRPAHRHLGRRVRRRASPHRHGPCLRAARVFPGGDRVTGMSLFRGSMPTVVSGMSRIAPRCASTHTIGSAPSSLAVWDVASGRWSCAAQARC